MGVGCAGVSEEPGEVHHGGRMRSYIVKMSSLGAYWFELEPSLSCKLGLEWHGSYNHES